VIGALFLQLPVSGQSVTLTKTDRLRKKKIWHLFHYVQKTPLDQISREKLEKTFIISLATDIIPGTDERSQKIFTWLLKGLDSTVDSINLKEYDAVPWNKFQHPENLPRMLWQAEPVTHLFGQPLDTKPTDRNKVVEEGKNQVAHTMVLYKKNSPGIPRFYILFDEQSNKIVSWTLIRQGPLHYFVSF
jgi:hypothetical protein